MDIYKKYKSPLGYTSNNGRVDSYGINHQNFSLRDELGYQYERQRRENKIIQGYNNQGITDNYPTQGTSFWGQNPDNNYGFGYSNIVSAVETIKQNPLPMMEQFGNNLANITSKFGIDKIASNVYNLGFDGGERLFNSNNNVQSGNYDNLSSVGLAENEAKRVTPMAISDENKHQYVSCVGSFDGPIAAAITGAAGLYKEGKDLYKKWNNPQYGNNWQILQDSIKDLKNNSLGIAKGLSASDVNQCGNLLPPQYRKKIF